MKHLSAFITLLVISFSAQAQIFFTEDFETDGAGTRYTLGAALDEFNDGTNDHYGRTDGTGISGSYSGQNGTFFWAGEDLDDNGGNGINPKNLVTASQNITGMTEVKISALVAQGASAGNGIDGSDYLHINYRIDGGIWTPAIWFSGTSGSNTGAFMDSDFNGVGEGTALTNTFATFDKNITVSGSTIELQFEMSMNSASEEIAYDFIQLDNLTPAPGVPSVQFVSQTVMVQEDATMHTICVEIDQAPTTEAVSILVPVTSQGASTPADYDEDGAGTAYFTNLGLLEWQIGDATNKCFDIIINDDMLIEGDEQMTFSIDPSITGGVIGANNTHVVTIVDNDIAPACTASLTVGTAICDAETNAIDTYTANFSYDASGETLDMNVSASTGTASTFSVVAGTTGMITVTGIPEGSDITLSLSNVSCLLEETIASPSCDAPVVPCSDLFFSEYIEGGGSNKCLEIYNPTGSAIDLATGEYAVYRYTNGSSTPSSTVYLTGTIASGDVFVICNSGADAEFQSVTDLNSGVTSFNGDDAVELVKGASTGVQGISLDVIGQIGFDPGSSWSANGCSTANNTLVRKSTIQGGDANGSDVFDPSVQWDCFGQDTSTELGIHSSDCVASCEISSITAGTQTACDMLTNLYTQEIVVTYSTAPATGMLMVNGQSFAVTTSPQTVTLIDLSSDGNDVDVTASFTDSPTCTATELALFAAPPACIISCSIEGATAGVQTSCDPLTNTYTQEVLVNYLNAPTGSIIVNGQSFAVTSSPQAVVLVGLVSDGMSVDVAVSFSDDAGCSASFTDVFTAAEDCTPVAPCTQLFISEYGEPSGGSDKYIEIYNPTGGDVDLSAYEIWKNVNGGSWPGSTVSLSGMLASGDVYVIAGSTLLNPNVDLSTGGVTGFNGDDGVALAYDSGAGVFEIIDVIGNDQGDPGSGYAVAGNNTGTANHILTRKSTVQAPNDDWSLSAGTDALSSEWILTAYTGGMELEDLGKHISDCIEVVENDDCSDAIVINTTVFGQPAWETFPLGLSESSPACAIDTDADDDVWFMFVAASANTQIIAQDPTGGYDAVIEVYETCGEGSLGCYNNYLAGEIERATPTGLVAGNTYYFRVYDAASGASASTDVRLMVKTFEDGGLQDAYCNVNTYDLSESVYAERDDLGQLYTNPNIPVTGYEFKFEAQGGGATYTYAHPTMAPYAVLADVGGGALEYGVTYDVSVRHQLTMGTNGAVGTYWSDFGTPCPITLEAALPSTQLAEGYCGATDLDLADQLQADYVAGATAYRFTFQGLDQDIVKITPSYGVQLSTVPGLQYGIVYTVLVQANVNGIWSPVGDICTIGMLSQPSAIQVLDEYCGMSYDAPDPNFIKTEQVYGATMYMWELASGPEGSELYETTTGLTLAFHLASNTYTPGMYAVRVKVFAGGQWGDYASTPCMIFINEMIIGGAEPLEDGVVDYSSKSNVETSFGAGLYPNPNAGDQFSLTLDVDVADALVSVYDVTGKLMQAERVLELGANTNLNITMDERLIPGVYLVTIEQNGTVESLRFIVD